MAKNRVKNRFLIMIYLCTHTDFNEYKKEGEYKIIAVKELNGKYAFPVIVADNDLKPLQFAYSEGYLIKDIYLKTDDEWVGINHYRRYFENPKHETTIPTPLKCNMHQQFAACHNIEDLYKVEKIIDTYFPEYSMDYSNINELYPCNMFIMKRDDFNEYYRFVFGVLEKFNEENHLQTDEDVYNYIVKNQTKYHNYQHLDIKYQSRLQGFLMERIGTIFFLKYFKDKPVSYRNITISK